MLRQVLTLGLALVVFWSGLATQEPLHLPVAGWVSDGHAGSVSDHHLDDRPAAQSIVEGAVDGAGPIVAGLIAPLPPRRSERPAEPARHEAMSPCLAGPLRPPRAVHVG